MPHRKGSLFRKWFGISLALHLLVQISLASSQMDFYSSVESHGKVKKLSDNDNWKTQEPLTKRPKLKNKVQNTKIGISYNLPEDEIGEDLSLTTTISSRKRKKYKQKSTKGVQEFNSQYLLPRSALSSYSKSAIGRLPMLRNAMAPKPTSLTKEQEQVYSKMKNLVLLNTRVLEKNQEPFYDSKGDLIDTQNTVTSASSINNNSISFISAALRAAPISKKQAASINHQISSVFQLVNAADRLTNFAKVTPSRAPLSLGTAAEYMLAAKDVTTALKSDYAKIFSSAQIASPAEALMRIITKLIADMMEAITGGRGTEAPKPAIPTTTKPNIAQGSDTTNQTKGHTRSFGSGSRVNRLSYVFPSSKLKGRLLASSEEREPSEPSYEEEIVIVKKSKSKQKPQRKPNYDYYESSTAKTTKLEVDSTKSTIKIQPVNWKSWKENHKEDVALPDLTSTKHPHKKETTEKVEIKMFYSNEHAKIEETTSTTTTQRTKVKHKSLWNRVSRKENKYQTASKQDKKQFGSSFIDNLLTDSKLTTSTVSYNDYKSKKDDSSERKRKKSSRKEGNELERGRNRNMPMTHGFDYKKPDVDETGLVKHVHKKSKSKSTKETERKAEIGDNVNIENHLNAGKLAGLDFMSNERSVLTEVNSLEPGSASKEGYLLVKSITKEPFKMRRHPTKIRSKASNSTETWARNDFNRKRTGKPKLPSDNEEIDDEEIIRILQKVLDQEKNKETSKTKKPKISKVKSDPSQVTAQSSVSLKHDQPVNQIPPSISKPSSGGSVPLPVRGITGPANQFDAFQGIVGVDGFEKYAEWGRPEAKNELYDPNIELLTSRRFSKFMYEKPNDVQQKEENVQQTSPRTYLRSRQIGHPHRQQATGNHFTFGTSPTDHGFGNDIQSPPQPGFHSGPPREVNTVPVQNRDGYGNSFLQQSPHPNGGYFGNMSPNQKITQPGGNQYSFSHLTPHGGGAGPSHNPNPYAWQQGGPPGGNSHGNQPQNIPGVPNKGRNPDPHFQWAYSNSYGQAPPGDVPQSNGNQWSYMSNNPGNPQPWNPYAPVSQDVPHNDNMNPKSWNPFSPDVSFNLNWQTPPNHDVERSSSFQTTEGTKKPIKVKTTVSTNIQDGKVSFSKASSDQFVTSKPKTEKPRLTTSKTVKTDKPNLVIISLQGESDSLSTSGENSFEIGKLVDSNEAGGLAKAPPSPKSKKATKARDSSSVEKH